MEGLKDIATEKTSQLKREVDSLDDFEHLGHDSSPLNEGKGITGDLLGLKSDVSSSARDVKAEIDKRVETAGTNITGSYDPFKPDLLDQPLIPQKMDSNLLQMGDNFPDRKEADAKLDKFLEDYKPTGQGIDKYGLHNIQSFMDNERGFAQEQSKTQSDSDLLDRYSDSEPEDDFKPSKYDDIPKKQELPESFGSTENFKAETFKDVDEIHPEIPKKDYPAPQETVREKTPERPAHKTPELPKKKTPEPIIEKNPEPLAKEKTPELIRENVSETVKEKTPESVKEKTPELQKREILEPVKQKIPEPTIEKTPEPVKKLPENKIEHKKPHIAPADAEAIFCKMGLDAWFNPERLNPKGARLDERRPTASSSRCKGRKNRRERGLLQPKGEKSNRGHNRGPASNLGSCGGPVPGRAWDIPGADSWTRRRLSPLTMHDLLDAVMRRDRLESLIYWRDPKKSGPVFGGVLVVLLALTYFSLISVVAYLSLIGLSGTIAFRIYKNIVQAIQKTGDGHPFKEVLELDISLPQDKVREISEVAVAHINAAVVELRRLFLVEDLVDSIKFGVLLWTLTYLGAWFNGMTLIIIAWVALFTLPKVYETNKTQIDANLEIVRTKLADISSKVKAAIPIGKKAEDKKEQ